MTLFLRLLPLTYKQVLKNLLLLGRVYTEEEVLNGLDSVSRESIEAIKPLVCNPANYSAVLVSNKKAALKKMVRG